MAGPALTSPIRNSEEAQIYNSITVLTSNPLIIACLSCCRIRRVTLVVVHVHPQVMVATRSWIDSTPSRQAYSSSDMNEVSHRPWLRIGGCSTVDGFEPLFVALDMMMHFIMLSR